MRKVTASAVILTAIAGCGRNEAPSAQWSFTPPEIETTVFSADTLQRQSSNQGNTSSSPEAQNFLAQTNIGTSDKIMGSAFGQTEGLSEDPAQTLVGDDQPTSPNVSIPTLPQRRTDPIAEVRAYLEKTRGSSFLGDRVPYSAQVALRPAPTYTSSVYSQQIASFAQPTPEPTANQAITGPGSTDPATLAQVTLPENSSIFNDAAQAVASLRQTPTQFSTSNLLTATAQPSTLQVQAVPVTAAVPLEDSPTETEAVSTEISAHQSQLLLTQTAQDTLPVLRPAISQQTSETSSTVAFASTEIQTSAQITEPVIALGEVPDEKAGNRDESIPIGTAILENLQRDRETVASEFESLHTYIDDVATTESPEIGPSAIKSSAIESIVISEEMPTDAKLARLLRTLPQRNATEQREEAPLISHFRSSQAASSHVSMNDHTESEYTEIELSESEQIETVHIESEQVRREYIEPNPSASSNPSRSLLLEGLEETANPTSALQTLYMPIPQAPALTASATLIQTALEALSSSADTDTVVSSLTVAHKSSESSTISGTAPAEQYQHKLSEPKAAEDYKAKQSSALSGSTHSEQAQDTLNSRSRNRQQLTRYRQRIVWQ